MRRSWAHRSGPAPHAATGYPVAMRREELRLRLDELYRQYDHRFVTPDPLEFVRAQATDADREVVGLLAAGLAFGTVAQIKGSIGKVLRPSARARPRRWRRSTPGRGREARAPSATAGSTAATWPAFSSSRARCAPRTARWRPSSPRASRPPTTTWAPPSPPSRRGPSPSTTAACTAAVACRRTPACATSSRPRRRAAPASGSTSTCGGWPAATASTSASGDGRTPRSSSCRSTPTRSRSRAGSA